MKQDLPYDRERGGVCVRILEGEFAEAANNHLLEERWLMLAPHQLPPTATTVVEARVAVGKGLGQVLFNAAFGHRQPAGDLPVAVAVAEPVGAGAEAD